ncbi:histidine kinase [Pontibacter ummariensis]|uniref:Histidine kinase n=1 Tax=Pontibacter ummariensis TaxID=1610492 RepID=A0A239D9R3_9BACT|nr:histidine kinase [Pontibacter ummariensis]PRY14324.1 histidine kinase [Pontibacter ummariensis]SNS29206.1 Histidine kinase [Pontibacter ummariensis]
MFRSKYIAPLIHLLVWLLGYLAVVSWVNTLGNFRSADHTLFLPVTLGTLVNVCLFYTTSLFLIPEYFATRRTAVFLLKLLLLLLGLTLLETVVDHLFFVNYYSTEEETLGTQFLLNILFNFMVLSLALGYGFTRSWFRNEKQRQQLKQEMLQAELNFLKAQVNPHFLFNVLNMAFSSAARSGDERTAGIIEKLANLMRYMLYESNVDSIELSREVDYLESFIELQKLRLSSEIKGAIRFCVTGDCSRVRIAPLLLIPFVENAFKHGIRLDKPSDILIQLEVAEEALRFRVENAIAQTQQSPERKVGGVGLENVRKRLALLYPGRHELQTYQQGDTFISSLTLTLK